MNTKLYKKVHQLAGNLMKAAVKEDRVTFTALFGELQSICDDNEQTDKDHPVQWETLADFTEDLAEAVTAYAKALVKAEAINSKDFMSSIAFSMATLQVELGLEDAAIESLQKAQVSANKIEDKELKTEITELLEELQAS
ncbi:MAG: hypothetical protein ACJASH_002078 [Bermanella sp.]|jgi:hypothetical protein